ncbi:hypothetical protein EPUL_005136, partial [Erysiphe pulchra]
MADNDSDVDMLLPTTLRHTAQIRRYNSKTLYSPGDPFISSDINPSKKINGSISKFTYGVFDDALVDISEREKIVEEYARALDEATSCVQKLGLDLDRNENEQMGLSQSIYATSQVTARGKKLSHADATKIYLPRITEANLSQKPNQSFPNHTPYVRKIDKRIFIWLLEENPSRNHHVHAIKSALTNNLEIAQDSIKTFQKVKTKTGLAFVSTNENHAEYIIGKTEAIMAISAGKVEKAEEWHTYLVDHVSRRLTLLEDYNWKVTELRAREEVQFITRPTPTRINWSRKTLENQLPIGTLIVSFKQATRPFRLFGTSSLARKLTKTSKLSHCTTYWGFHDSRLCNHEQRFPCAGLRPPPTQAQFKLIPDAIPHFSAGVKEISPHIELLPEDTEKLAQTIIRSIQVNMERFFALKIQHRQGTKWWAMNAGKRHRPIEWPGAEEISQGAELENYQTKIQLNETIDMAEIEHCLLNTANTAPGTD